MTFLKRHNVNVLLVSILIVVAAVFLVTSPALTTITIITAIVVMRRSHNRREADRARWAADHKNTWGF